VRVGVLGGSFDPPHVGHLRMARLAMAQLQLDRVLFIPCFSQPLKGAPPLVSPFHRSAMLALAIAGRSAWAVDFRELEWGGPSYTAVTLASLRAQFSRDTFFLVMGSDSLASFDQWQRSKDILAMAELAVVPRAGERETSWPRGGDRVHILKAAPLSVSSTAVRDLLVRGQSIEGLVPKAVMSYIVRQLLYAVPSGRRERRSV